MRDLFTPLTRDERQEESLKKWMKNKGIGTLECCTGYGKSRVTINIIKIIPAFFIFFIVHSPFLLLLILKTDAYFYINNKKYK